jgi:hypothetical protein
MYGVPRISSRAYESQCISAFSISHVSDSGNVMLERACRAHSNRGGLPNPEGAWRVLWPCDPIIGQPMLALRWRPLRGADSTPDWLSWILPLRQQSCRAHVSRGGLLN